MSGNIQFTQSLRGVVMMAVLTGGLMFTAFGASDQPSPLIIAHRGSSFIAPENTLAAYELAWQQGAPAAECDVYLTKDHEIILLHDGTFKRTAGVDRKPADMTWGEIALLDAGSWKGDRWAGEGVPRLQEVLTAMPPDRHLFIEIKCGPEIMPALKRLLDTSGRKSQVTIIGFNKDTMLAARTAMPDIPIKWLLGAPKNEETGEYEKIDPARVAECKVAKFDGLNVSRVGVSPELFEAARAAGQPLYVWTVNDMEEAKRLAEMGAAGITTDKPDLMLEALGFKKK